MGTLVFQATLGGAINLIGPNTASTVNFTLPSADGTSGQALSTNGSGTLSFGTLAVGAGGTGQTSYTDGQLLIGNSTGNTLTKATLTAGTNVTITNAAGAITIAASGGGASAATPTALGTVYGLTNTGGNFSISLGYQAGSTSTGTNNTSIGFQAGYTNNNNRCTFLGYRAGYLSDALENTFLGYQAGVAVTSGDYNTFVGTGAGLANTTGVRNTFVGRSSGEAITTGGRNSILGWYSGNQDGLDIRTASNYAFISDGDGNRLLTTANGQTLALDGGAVPNSGTGITFPATQSASSNANTLDDYDEYTAASSPCTLALTVSVVWKLTKVGNKVTLMLPPTFGTCAAAQSAWQYGVLLPSKYRPANEITLPVGLKDNGVVVTGIMGMIYITTGGEIRVYKSFNGTDTFTNGTAIGIAQNAGTSISWII